MESLIRKIEMRARTALMLFFTAVVAGGLLAVLVDAFAEDAAPKPKIVRVEAGRVPATNVGGAPRPGPLQWREFAAGLEEADRNEKLVLVDVYTDWCGWCKRMEKTTYGDSLVLEYLAERYVPVKVNAESKAPTQYRGEDMTYREMAGGFGIRSYPTTLFLEADGSPITTVPGYWKPEDFIVILHFIGERHYKDKNFEDFSKEWKAKRN